MRQQESFSKHAGVADCLLFSCPGKSESRRLDKQGRCRCCTDPETYYDYSSDPKDLQHGECRLLSPIANPMFEDKLIRKIPAG